MSKERIQMFEPPHVGQLIKEEFLEPNKISISKFAQSLGVNRAYVSKIINEQAGVSPAMALRLSIVLNTSVGLWLNMQQQYDLWEAKKNTDLTKVKPLDFTLIAVHN
jgi:antitoxin HigA-1